MSQTPQSYALAHANIQVLTDAGAGGKAVGLARLNGLGVSVPEAQVWIGLQTDALPDCEPIWSSLGPTPLAVRSSAQGEDGTEASFAGQYESVLGVSSPNALREAIHHCLSAVTSERATAYRAEQGEAARPSMSLVIQKMVPAKWAGVLFTADPTTGRRDRVVLDAIPGLGDRLVSGEVDPEHILAHPTGEIVTHRVPNEADAVPAHLVQTLIAQAMDIARQLDGPQDLEWAIDEDLKVWWLQTRPITTLPLPLTSMDSQDVDPQHVFTRCNIGEMMPGAVTPLTRSVTMRGIDYGIQAMQVRVGVREAIESRAIFTATFGGHSFLNLSAFGPMVRGVAGSNTERLCRAICGRAIEGFDLGPPYSAWRRAWNGFRYVRYLLSGNRHRKRLQQSLAELVVPQDGTAETWLTWIDDHLPVLNQAYDDHMTASAFSGAMTSTLAETISKGQPPTVEDEALCAALLCQGERPEVESMDIAAGAQKMAESINQNAEAKAIVLNESIEDAARWLHADDGEAGLIWRQYLERHGHRAIRELELRQPEWSHDPTPLIESLRVALQYPTPPFEVAQSVAPEVSRTLRWMAKKARQGAAQREHTKSMLVAVTTRFKVAYRRLGEALTQAGLIDDSDQVFFFYHEELPRVMEGEKGLTQLANARRETLKYQSQLQFPEIFEGVGIPEDPLQITECPDGGLIGTPVSPGTVEGTARIVRSIADLQTVEPGDILIASVVDVGWTPCFSLIAGLATEIGSSASHGCVVAREYGLPAVVGLKGATTLFKNGQRVRLDAKTGTLIALDEHIR